MPKNIIARTAMLSALAACLLATPVLADSSPATTTDTVSPDTTSIDASATDSVTTGSVNVEQSAKKRMDDCMAIWEKRTHMSKAEWRHTCETSLKEF